MIQVNKDFLKNENYIKTVIEKLCRIKTQYAINKLNPSSTDMIFIQYEELCLELNKQLQSYKDKEDKIRELIKATPLPSSDYMENLTTMFMFKKDILDILNEGDK